VYNNHSAKGGPSSFQSKIIKEKKNQIIKKKVNGSGVIEWEREHTARIPPPSIAETFKIRRMMTLDIFFQKKKVFWRVMAM
jgi:hypothetical protein